MFVEDLDRPGLAGLWAEAEAAPAPTAGRAGRRTETGLGAALGAAGASAPWSPVAISRRPRSAPAALALEAFHAFLEGTRP